MSEQSQRILVAESLDARQSQTYEKLNAIEVQPRADGYQTTDIFNGFDMAETFTLLCEEFDLPPSQTLYLVVFRSQRREDLTDDDIERLTELDNLAHSEASERIDDNGRRSLLHYFKGQPDKSGYCVSWCVWTSEEIAQLASRMSRPGEEVLNLHHQNALLFARHVYQRHGIQSYRIRPTREGFEAALTQDTWTHKQIHSGGQGRSELPEQSGSSGDVVLRRAIGAIGI